MNLLSNLFPIYFPLWISLIFNFFAFLIAFGIGAFLGSHSRSKTEQKDWSPIGSVVIASLFLVVILLSTTYGISYIKYNTNQEYFLEEANALETVYLRAGYLNDSDRKELRTLLKEYVLLRYNMFKKGHLKESIVRSEKLHNRIWEYTDQIAKENPNSIMIGLFVEALSDAIDHHEKRVNWVFNAEIPWAMWLVLYFIVTVAIVNMGYFFGVTHTHHFVICSFFILTISALISLIIDLNHPQQGFILTDSQSLKEVIHSTFNEE